MFDFSVVFRRFFVEVRISNLEDRGSRLFGLRGALLVATAGRSSKSWCVWTLGGVWGAIFDPRTLRAWRRKKKMRRAVIRCVRPLKAVSRPGDRQITLRDKRPALLDHRREGAKSIGGWEWMLRWL